MSDPTQPRLRQLNAAYDAVQDRVLLRVVTSAEQEFRFWITRRFMGLLWQAITRVLEAFAKARAPGDPLLAAALADFAETRAMQGADFATPFGDGAQFPLGDAPILLSRITVLAGPAGQQLLRLTPEQGQGIDLALDENLAHLLVNLLLQAVAASDWALDLASAGATLPAPPAGTPHRVH